MNPLRRMFGSVALVSQGFPNILNITNIAATIPGYQDSGCLIERIGVESVEESLHARNELDDSFLAPAGSNVISYCAQRCRRRLTTATAAMIAAYA